MTRLFFRISALVFYLGSIVLHLLIYRLMPRPFNIVYIVVIGYILSALVIYLVRFGLRDTLAIMYGNRPDVTFLNNWLKFGANIGAWIFLPTFMIIYSASGEIP